MVSFTNLPQIGASQVTNAGTTSNDADAAIVNALASARAETVDNSNAFTITNVASTYYWERNVAWRFTDAGSPPTAQITVTVPASPARGAFVILNKTGQDMAVEISGQPLTAPVIKAGKSALLTSDGTNVELASSAGASTLEELTDVDSLAAAGTGQVLAKAAGGNAEWVNQAAGSGDALPFTLSPKWRGAIMVIDSDKTGQDFEPAAQFPWDSAHVDTDAIADPSNNRFVVPSGVTKIRLRAQLALDLFGGSEFYMEVRKNGSTIVPTRPQYREDPVNSLVTLQAYSSALDVGEGDTIDLLVGTGGDSSVTVSAGDTWFEMEVVETTDTVPSLRTVVASLPARWRGAIAYITSDRTAQNYTTQTKVPWDATLIDTDSMFDDANDYFVVPAGVSKIAVTGQVALADADIDGMVSLNIYKNGTVISPIRPQFRMERPQTDTVLAGQVHAPMIPVTEGDTIQLNVSIQADASVTLSQTDTWFSVQILEFNSSTDAPVAYIAVPPEHKGAIIKRTSGQTLTTAIATDIIWQATEEDTTFDPGDGGPAQRFWFGANWTFVDGDITVGTDTIAETAHGYQTGEGPVRLTNSGGALPTGLAVDTNYWIIRVDADNLKLASSRANALAGMAVDITAASGGGTHTVDQEEYLVVPAGVARARIQGQLDWGSAGTGNRNLTIEKRNASDAQVAQVGSAVDFRTANNSSLQQAGTYDGLPVSEGDRFVIVGLHTQGSNLDVDGAGQTWFSMSVVEEARAVTYPGVAVTPPSMGALAIMVANDTGRDFQTAAAAINFDDEVYDTDAFHDTVTNNSRLTIPTGLGITKVRLTAQVRVDNQTADTWASAWIRKSGADTWDGNPSERVETGMTAGTHINLESPVIDVVDGDYFELMHNQESDTSVDVRQDWTWFSIEVVERDTYAFPPEEVHFFQHGAPATSDVLWAKVFNRRTTVNDALAGTEGYALGGGATEDRSSTTSRRMAPRSAISPSPIRAVQQRRTARCRPSPPSNMCSTWATT